jgi:hypothetical protein
MQDKLLGASALLLGLASLGLSINPGRADMAGHRYVWGELPFTFVTPERVINGTTTCITDPYGNGERHHNPANRIPNNWTNNRPAQDVNNKTGSTITTCTTKPARVIPSSSYTRLLQVQYDCTDQTYDAKGDGKAWRNVRAGYGDGIYDQFKRVCQIDADPQDRPKP